LYQAHQPQQLLFHLFAQVGEARVARIAMLELVNQRPHDGGLRTHGDAVRGTFGSVQHTTRGGAEDVLDASDGHDVTPRVSRICNPDANTRLAAAPPAASLSMEAAGERRRAAFARGPQDLQVLQLVD
jgi:hypothetical protein